MPKERANFFNFFKKGSELWIECLYIISTKKDRPLKIKKSSLSYFLFLVTKLLNK